MKKTNVIKMVFVALMAAIMCVLAPLSISVGVIPISLGSFALYLIATLTDRKMGTLAVIVYVLLGLVGVPVFAGWTGGFAKLAGPTGGYIIGFIPCAYLAGLVADKLEKHKWIFPVGMIAGTVVLYAFGTAWYMVQSGTALGAALMGCVVPFLAGDAIKVAAASAIVIPVRGRLKKWIGGAKEKESAEPAASV